MNDIFISEDELENLRNKFIGLKGKNGLDILKFIANNLKHTKESALLAYNKKEIKREEVFTFINAQEKLFNNLLTVSKKHRNILYDFLDFKPDDEKIISYEENISFLFEVYANFLKTYINDLFNIIEVKPTLERIEKGKTQKAKKPDQIKAEEWVKDVWRMHPDVTQGQMAIDVKDALDLPQTIKTITGWIKPLDPQKGKRKRKPKDYYQ